MSVDVSYIDEAKIQNVRIASASNDAVLATPSATTPSVKVFLKCTASSAFLSEGEFKVFVESVVAMMGWKKTTQQIF
jgi:hypothetical protein